MKKCRKCEIEKEFKDFHKSSQRKDGLRSECKNCRNKEIKECRNKNRERINQYCRERRKNDPLFRLRCNLSGITRWAIKNGYKSASTQELLGCTWEEVKIHIENQFVDGMCWQNYGKWEVDHIKPIAAFTDLTDPEQQRQCCHYTNLQPLWMQENRSKSSWWDGIKH